MEKYRKKIEEYSAIIEQLGFTPVVSRVFVYLMFYGSEGATFEEMVKYFGVSKSAVSNALKTLNDFGIVDFRTNGGQRKRHFYLNLRNLFNEKIITSRYRQMYSVLEGVRQERDTNTAFDTGLAEMATFYKMFLIEVPIILERWKKTIGSDN